MSRAFLLSYQQYLNDETSFESFQRQEVDRSQLLGDRHVLGFPNAKKGIHYLMEQFHLKRDDEVWIVSTSDSPFVSSCVSCTIFNYSKISRILTDKTRMIWVIHEFGFPCRRMDELLEIAKKRGIPLVEDSAHTMNSFANGMSMPLGMRGDFGLFSLPKFFPLSSGGLLVGRKLSTQNTHFVPALHDHVMKEFLDWLPYLYAFAERRKEHFKFFSRCFSDYNLVFPFSESIDPFVFGFHHPQAASIHNHLDHAGSMVEFARTYNPGWILLPVNALLKQSHLTRIVEALTSVLEGKAVYD